MSYVLIDRSTGTEPIMVFTGDALFVGDVGRTDLYGPDDAPRLARLLYRSIFEKLLPLGDGVILSPAHGAGSVCGGNISERIESTLGIERMQNPVLPLRNKDEFVAYKLREHHERPPYFRQMERYNLEGAPRLGLSTVEELKRRLESGEDLIVLDVRDENEWQEGHIKDAFHIYVGELQDRLDEVPRDRPISVLCSIGHRGSLAASILLRAGYTNL